jgi:hypothetical protein
MPTSIQNAQVTRASTGFFVSRPSTASGNTPLAPGPTNLFTIAGGQVLLVYLAGQVTTIIQAQATTTSIIATPTAGSAVSLSNATLDITGLEVGGSITLAATLGAAAIKANAGAVIPLMTKIILNPGTISVTFGAASTGAIKWNLIYVPLDPAASVVATA